MNVPQINSKKGDLLQIQTLLRADPALANLLTHDVDDLDEHDLSAHGNYRNLTDKQLIFIGYVSRVTELPIAEFGLDPSHHRIQEVLGSRGLLKSRYSD